MPIKITNTNILIDKQYLTDHLDQVLGIVKLLTYVDKKTLEEIPMYQLDEHGVSIPIGYLDYIGLDLSSSDIIDNRTKNSPSMAVDKESIAKSLGKIEKILPNITLRSDQIISVYFALSEKSGIFQLATGAGKTEIISAIIKYWNEELNYYPNIIILEPTVKLVKQTIERLARYGIYSEEYNSSRNIEGIKVTHPSSMYNDIQQHPDHLSNLHCIICDEGHHLSAATWRAILNYSNNLEIRLAFSASVVDQERVDFKSLSELSYEEHLILGVIGKIRVNYPPSYYIEKGILATPVVFRILNPANEPMKIKYRPYRKYSVDYHAIKKYRIGSSVRIEKCMSVVNQLLSKGLNVLVLAETKEFSEMLLKESVKYGISDKCRTVYGGNESYLVTKLGDIVTETRNSMELLEKGEVSVIIATSVLYEGADIKVLDAVVLFSVGVEQRIFIQGIGRALRKGKTGKYAYIIDFTDHECNVLRKHSFKRRDMYMDILGIPQSRIFDGIESHEILKQYIILEENK